MGKEKNKYTEKTKAEEVDSDKYHYITGHSPGEGYRPHEGSVGKHYDYHETSRITSKDSELRERFGGERLDSSTKVGHLKTKKDDE